MHGEAPKRSAAQGDIREHGSLQRRGFISQVTCEELSGTLAAFDGTAVTKLDAMILTFWLFFFFMFVLYQEELFYFSLHFL